ncbi:MAG: T9SS type A sorting domain-containing protein, partial [Planctomycetia bacterium]|nr:T9SS type A sorting domain-containing protein [Planctomycetia bacterium]
LAFAEGDESGGVHNHLYTMALLNDVIEKTTSTVGVDDNLNPILKEFALYQNYPNPFNPSTDIKFNLPEVSTVKLDVFNISGERVATLLNKQENAGLHTVKFDASNLASGTYFFRIIAGEYQKTMKMILLR